MYINNNCKLHRVRYILSTHSGKYDWKPPTNPTKNFVGPCQGLLVQLKRLTSIFLIPQRNKKSTD